MSRRYSHSKIISFLLYRWFFQVRVSSFLGLDYQNPLRFNYLTKLKVFHHEKIVDFTEYLEYTCMDYKDLVIEKSPY